MGSHKWLKTFLVLFLCFIPLVLLGVPRLVAFVGRTLGRYLRRKTADRRAHILRLTKKDEKTFVESKHRTESEDWENVESYASGTTRGEKADMEWDGIVGFFHPFCNAGGGGERVLWAAIRATQKRWPHANCVVYTGDHDVDKAAILIRVQERFNILLHPPTITFLYLTSRHWILATTWPHFTLLGQSLGSLILAWDAFSLLVPDIYVDTMGYAFTLGLSRLLFPDVPTGAYVHYPTISTDMLRSLDASPATAGQGVNAGKGAGAQGAAKRLYWETFAKLYMWMGASVDIVMTNSSWTLDHINILWEPWRNARQKQQAVIVYPPVAVEELKQEVEVSPASEGKRGSTLLYIAQFRPEKNHKLILQAFSSFMASKTPATKEAKLVLIGSVRDDMDSKRVYELRLLANELGIRDSVEFHLDASWPEILDWLRNASVGVNGMWNEHFGIGVVEYQAAGLITVAHDSGGPKRDIVTPVDGLPTGSLANTATDFASAFETILALSQDQKVAMRLRARKSAERFTEEEFARQWVSSMEKLIWLDASNKASIFLA